MQPPAEPNAQSSPGCPNSQPRREGENQIVLVGASIRPAAQSAKRAGFRVTGIDLFGDTDTLAACDRYFRIGENDSDEIVRACQGVPTVQVGGLHGQNPLLKRLMATHPSSGNGTGPDQLREVGYLRELSVQTGFCFPPTFEGPIAANRDLTEKTSGWLRKARHGCGGLGVRWYDPRQDASTSDLIQKWIPGRAYGATLLSNGSAVCLLGVCRSLFTRNQDRPFVFAGSLGPLAVSSARASSLIRIGERVVATTRLRGLLNVDYLLDRSGKAWLLEINPRWSGSSELIERQLIGQHQIDCGDSLLARMLSALNGDVFSSEIESKGKNGHRPESDSVYLKRIIFARAETQFDRTRITSLLESSESLHDLPADGTVMRQGDPVCTLIRQIDHKKDPMRRHRVLLRAISGARDGYSPRSSA